uniref:tRNA(Ile)-lysidine synthase, chloroplastic n=1 Tax=Bulboplastis apyrenoidosa TaxID=1070855 RepID=A0A1Y9TME1_9RHOD|nr:tRNA(Ile)-lysidine synthase [Bulboplastis apyrenoidosa]ARO90808.1 tRNA(Ile)-lysidine synthase [Bulboplastis apyrenoidosa]
MLSILHQQVIKLVTSFYVLKYRKILIALSGGQDSLCLVKILKDLQPYYNFSIYGVHFNHHWRRDSNQNMALLLQLLIYWNVESYIYQFPRVLLNELESRQWRYKVLYFLLIKKHYQTIMTAHTATDQVEVFFLNLLRGSSPESLTSLVFQNQLFLNIFINRPLLFCNRKDISWFCRKFFLPVWSDFTNFNYITKRNRIREEMIPYMMNFFNLKIERHTIHLMDHLYYDEEYLRYISLYFYYKFRHKNIAGIDRVLLSMLHHSVQLRVLKLLLKKNLNISINKRILNILCDRNTAETCVTLNNCKSRYFCQILLYVNKQWIYFLYNYSIA